MTAHDPLPFGPLAPGTQPDNNSSPYRSTHKCHPTLAPLRMVHTITETSGPHFSPAHFPPNTDISVVDGKPAMDGRPVPETMIEIWQANTAGRYHHARDRHDAPLDPNFRGIGRLFTDAEGHYQFISIRPGAYPRGNHQNAWRPNHIHFSFFGSAYATRLITQIYFPGDPLLALDPIFNIVPDETARGRLVARFDLGITQPGWALGYRFDVVLRGRLAMPMES